jgi:hypothetical protein
VPLEDAVKRYHGLDLRDPMKKRYPELGSFIEGILEGKMKETEHHVTGKGFLMTPEKTVETNRRGTEGPHCRYDNMCVDVYRIAYLLER